VRSTADSRVTAGGDNGRFSDALDDAMKGSTPTKEKAFGSARRGLGATSEEPAPQEAASGGDQVVEDQPALLAGLQELPSQIVPVSEPADGESAGTEQSEDVEAALAPHLAEGTATEQAVNPLVVQVALPAQVTAAAFQQGGKAQPGAGDIAGAETDGQDAEPWEAETKQRAAGPQGEAPGRESKVSGESIATTATEAVPQPIPEAADTQPSVRLAGGPATVEAMPLPASALPATAAPSPPPAELRGYATAFVPPPPARQISPAILSLSARPGSGEAPSRLVVALRPDDLGRVEITMEQAPDGPAEVRLCAERPETLRMLMRDTDAIQSVLQHAGVGTENGRNLSFSLSQGGGDGQASSEQDPRHQPRQRHPEQGRDEAPRLSLAVLGGRSVPLGRIDIAL
jgi:flagellar hook-length control protein FliK